MKKNLTINKYFLLLFSLLTISCSSDEEDIPIQIVEPSTYDFLRDGQSTVSFSGQTTRLNQADAIYNAFLCLLEADVFFLFFFPPFYLYVVIAPSA